MDENKNDEKKKFKISDLYNNKRYYAIANLIFYGILIICLIVIVRGTPDPITTKNNRNQNTNVVESSVEGFNNIKAKNFNFKYTVTKENVSITYTGKQYNNSVSFIESEKEYFYQDGLFFEKENDKYVLNTDYNIEYFDFFNVDTIEKIISTSKLQDEVLVISKDEINSILNEEDKSIESIQIKLAKSNGIITKVEFELTESNNDQNKPIILLEYSDYGLIEEFNIKNN